MRGLYIKTFPSIYDLILQNVNKKKKAANPFAAEEGNRKVI